MEEQAMRIRKFSSFGQVRLPAPWVVVLVALPWASAVAQDSPQPPPAAPPVDEASSDTTEADSSATTGDLSVLETPDAGLHPTPATPPSTSQSSQSQEPPAKQDAAPADEQPLQPVPDPMAGNPIELEPASFKGVVPGTSTMEQVEKAWGEPKQVKKQDNAVVHLYSVESFEHIEITYHNDKVTAIVIRFGHAFPASAVAEQLELTHTRPVLISNDMGEILGQAYPESGVLFGFTTSEKPGKASMQVSEIILEPISAEPFVLRAETELQSRCDLSRQDLQQALKLQPNNARAHWLYSRVLVAVGDFNKAEASSAQAVRLEPGDAQYRVTWAQILGQLGRLSEAIREAKTSVETGKHRPHVKARALCLLGDLMASGATPNYHGAMQYHMQALKEATPLASNRHPAIRLVAKEVLVDAHLGAAHDIAWGTWKEKEEAVQQWLGRAETLAKDLFENEGNSQEHCFRVSTRALAAYVGLHGKLDPNKWAKEARRSGEELISATEDPWRKAQFQWDLGMALYDALQVSQMRNDHDAALNYGQWAVEHLQKSQRQDQSAAASYLLGRLYFRLGAIYAIRDKNHQEAVAWFDKALPLLKKPIPKETFADLGRHGETFVSMGVSYWEMGRMEKAVELTEIGADLLQQAVKQGAIDGALLSVPYSNLASMHRQLKQNDQAERYEVMATRNKDTKVK
jgi:tetratricopeptide (TPR) repeat protein